MWDCGLRVGCEGVENVGYGVSEESLDEELLRYRQTRSSALWFSAFTCECVVMVRLTVANSRIQNTYYQCAESDD